MNHGHQISPLFVSIIAQAWGFVKAKNNGQAPLFMTLSDALEDPMDHKIAKMFAPSVWQHVWESHLWSHPHHQDDLSSTTKNTHARIWINTKSVGPLWGQDGRYVVCGPQEWAALTEEEKTTAQAVMFKWSPNWLSLYEQDISDLIHQHRHVHRVLCLPSEYFKNLTEEDYWVATQLGLTWWMMPPSADQFLDYLQSHKRHLRFIMTHPQSEQWVWPWCDIMVKNVSEMVLGKEVERYYIPDQRQKQAWIKMEADVAAEMEKIMGGRASYRMLVRNIIKDLDAI